MSCQSRNVQAIVAAVLLAAVIGPAASAQERWSRGQNVQPVFEGWERNADGSFTMVFGYLNRNYEEQPVIPVGTNNRFEPGPADRGQPTHFYNRRQQFAFTVRVPADWGREQDLVWTVTHNGRTDRAIGHLWPVWEIDDGVLRLNRGSGTAQGYADNQRPFVRLEGEDHIEVTLPDTLEIAVVAGDDGVPPPNPRLAERRARRGPEVAGDRRSAQGGGDRPRRHVAALARPGDGDVRPAGSRDRRGGTGRHPRRFQRARHLRSAGGGRRHGLREPRQRHRDRQAGGGRAVGNRAVEAVASPAWGADSSAGLLGRQWESQATIVKPGVGAAGR